MRFSAGLPWFKIASGKGDTRLQPAEYFLEQCRIAGLFAIPIVADPSPRPGKEISGMKPGFTSVHVCMVMEAGSQAGRISGSHYRLVNVYLN